MMRPREVGARSARSTAMPLLLGVYAIWLREVKRALRDRGQLIGGISRPLLWVLIMGVGLNPYFRGEIFGEVRFVVPFTYVQFIFPAVIALNILYTSVQSAVSTIWRILSRRGFVVGQPQKRPRSSWRTFCAEQPNERWQADITHWRLADGSEVEILNILDDHSRVNLAAHARRITTGRQVVDTFLTAFGRWGMPAVC